MEKNFNTKMMSMFAVNYKMLQALENGSSPAELSSWKDGDYEILVRFLYEGKTIAEIEVGYDCFRVDEDGNISNGESNKKHWYIQLNNVTNEDDDHFVAGAFDYENTVGDDEYWKHQLDWLIEEGKKHVEEYINALRAVYIYTRAYCDEDNYVEEYMLLFGHKEDACREMKKDLEKERTNLYRGFLGDDEEDIDVSEDETSFCAWQKITGKKVSLSVIKKVIY